MAPIAALQLGLVGRAHLDAGTAERIEAIEQHGAYPHLLFKLRRLPSFGPPFEHLNADPRTRFNTTLVPDPELQQTSYEACRRGEVPQHPPVGMQIPTVMDPSLAPEGFHIATTYGFFFPCEAPRDDRGRLRDEMAERILRSLSAARRATPVPASRSSRGTAPPKRSPRRSVPSPARRREALHRSVPPSMVAACGSVPCTRRCRPQVEGAQKASFTRCDDGRGSTPHVR